ncbi:unnamed protein product [Mortierella alpina]
MLGAKTVEESQEHDPQPSNASSARRSSSASASASKHHRQPISTTFSLAPMTTTTVVTTTTTTSTEYPPLYFKPPPIPAHLDPKIFPLADTPTPPALKKFCFNLNGQPTFFRENQENERTMGQLEDALFNLSASAHQRALRSASEHASQQRLHPTHNPKAGHKEQDSFSLTQQVVRGKGQDQSTMTTITRRSVEHPQHNLGSHPAWRGCRAKKRPASPITPGGSVEVSMPQPQSSAALPESAASNSSTLPHVERPETSFLGRSSPPHKKSKRPWANSPLQTEPAEGSTSTSSRKMPSSASAPTFAEFATPALPTRSRATDCALEHGVHPSQIAGFVDPSSLPSPSLSPPQPLKAQLPDRIPCLC